MKQELRCHAVLCPSENKARLMAKRLKERLHQALVDFKKEKVWRQNARLSLANAADEQKTMPFRKIMLQAGSSNYRPPLEKGKSAPKLKVIEEVILEEDEDQLSEDEATITQDPDLVRFHTFVYILELLQTELIRATRCFFEISQGEKQPILRTMGIMRKLLSKRFFNLLRVISAFKSASKKTFDNFLSISRFTQLQAKDQKKTQITSHDSGLIRVS